MHRTVGAKTLVPFFKTIPDNEELSFLSLFRTEMSTKGATILAEAIARNSSLKFLRITDETLGEEGWLQVRFITLSDTSAAGRFLHNNSYLYFGSGSCLGVNTF